MTHYLSLVSTQAVDRATSVTLTDGSINDQGLVLPNITPNLEAKIADDINDVHHRIMLHAREGKHILYLPGAYDLVHVGHASYVQQAVQCYIDEQGLDRQDIYVLVLADSDELIEATKGSPRSGRPTRPLQTSDIFNSLAVDFYGHNPRLYDLACLDVDCAGLIPSPADLKSLMQKGAFREWFNSYSSNNISTNDLDQTKHIDANVLKGIEGYFRLVNGLQNRKFAEVAIDFHSARRDPEYDPNNGSWNIASWQTFMHKFLGSGSLDNPCLRVISENDVDYKDIVAELMNRVGIGHIMFKDAVVLSTTDLENAFGWQELVGAKMDHYMSVRSSI